MFTISGPKRITAFSGATKISFNTGRYRLNSYGTEDINFTSDIPYFMFTLYRSLKRARDVRDQLVNLLARVEVDLVSNPLEHVNIRKVS